MAKCPQPSFCRMIRWVGEKPSGLDKKVRTTVTTVHRSQSVASLSDGRRGIKNKNTVRD